MDSKRSKAQFESLVLVLVALGFCVAANAASYFGDIRKIDMTKTERHTLSKGSGSLLASMKQNMRAEFYVTRGLPALETHIREVKDLLTQYHNAGGKDKSGEFKFKFEIIETKDEDSKKKAKEAGLKESQFGAEDTSNDTVALSAGYMGVVLYYGDEKDPLDLPPGRTDGLEFWISNKMREMRDEGDKIEHQIGIVTGKEELKLSDTHLVPAAGQGGKPSLQQIIQQHFKSYKIKDVDLKNGDGEIDDKLDGLILTQPGKDYSEKELRRIDQFVMKGKSLVVYESAVNTKVGDAQLAVTLNTWGVEKLLEGYGIKINKDVILDYRGPVQFTIPTQGGMARGGVPWALQVAEDQSFKDDSKRLDTSFPAFFRMTHVAMPMVSSLTLDPQKQTGNTLKAVARSTDQSYAFTDNVELRKLSAKKGGQKGQFIVAAELEGPKIKSAFLSGDKQGVEAPAESTGPARVLVISAAQFLTNPFARAGAGPDMGQFGMQFGDVGGDEQLKQLAFPYAQAMLTHMILSLKNTLDWMSGDTDLLAASAKILSEPTLNYQDREKLDIKDDDTEESIKKKIDDIKQSRKSIQATITWSLLVGVPLLFILFGLARWQWRMSKRASITLA